MGVTDLVSLIKRVDNQPDFKQFEHVIQYGLYFNDIEGESTGANDSNTRKLACCVNNSKCRQRFDET